MPLTKNYGNIFNVWSFWLSRNTLFTLETRVADLEKLREREKSMWNFRDQLQQFHSCVDSFSTVMEI